MLTPTDWLNIICFVILTMCSNCRHCYCKKSEASMLETSSWFDSYPRDSWCDFVNISASWLDIFENSTRASPVRSSQI